MAIQLLMPKATAVWLIENTALTFEQIADFCSIHELEVKSIADGDSAQGIKGLDPVQIGQLTRDAIKHAENNPDEKLVLLEPKVPVPPLKKKGSRYTPLSRRQDRPNAILWLLRNHPEMKDLQIIRLVGTTKSTISAIRDRTHWNSVNLQPLDPVALGICSQIDLDFEVSKATQYLPTIEISERDQDCSLLPASETQDSPSNLDSNLSLSLDANSVFKNFNNISSNYKKEKTE
ncbi:DUF1013 domain-containing protein [Candidatus Endowatersipora endosymbiont of Watersipora subatra]|uniref:DUF1013 domain-containing protein n=1 Tax=Candidatus Endowatersipora endosymbiont of Watersipora subatra TaxID=3077946 RepID=UPI00312C8B81